MVYFIGVPIEDKANKVKLEYEVHRLVLQINLSENNFGISFTLWACL